MARMCDVCSQPLGLVAYTFFRECQHGYHIDPCGKDFMECTVCNSTVKRPAFATDKGQKRQDRKDGFIFQKTEQLMSVMHGLPQHGCV